jgi:hypothetical protein
MHFPFLIGGFKFQVQRGSSGQGGANQTGNLPASEPEAVATGQGLNES